MKKPFETTQKKSNSIDFLIDQRKRLIANSFFFRSFHVFVATSTVIQIIQKNKESKRTYLNIDNDDENKNRFLIEIYSVELFVTQPHCVTVVLLFWF